MTKSGLECDYPPAVEALKDYVQNFELSGDYSNTYCNDHGRVPYHTL